MLSWVGVAAFACGMLLSVVMWRSDTPCCGFSRDTGPGVFPLLLWLQTLFTLLCFTLTPERWPLCTVSVGSFASGFQLGSARGVPTGWRAMESEVRILFPSRVSQTGKWPLSDGHSSCRAALPTSTPVPDSGVYPSPSCVRPWGMKSLPLPNPPSLLAQGPALSLIASLCPTRLFVNSPFIKFPSNYHN